MDIRQPNVWLYQILPARYYELVSRLNTRVLSCILHIIYLMILADSNTDTMPGTGDLRDICTIINSCACLLSSLMKTSWPRRALLTERVWTQVLTDSL